MTKERELELEELGRLEQELVGALDDDVADEDQVVRQYETADDPRLSACDVGLGQERTVRAVTQPQRLALLEPPAKAG